MGDRSPRRGSIAYWHRARSKRLVPRVRHWPNVESGLAAFAGYKAGMHSILMVDDTEAATKGQEVVVPITVIEVPPMLVYAIVGYKETTYGLKAVAQVNAGNLPKQAKRALVLTKKPGDAAKLSAQECSEFRVLVCTQPWKTGFAKKTPEVVEIGLGGSSDKQLEYAKSVLGKEVKASDVLKAGEYLDAIAVTKGKGWQGVVKRHGVAINPRKANQARRHGGTIGGETQAKVMYTIPRAGQMGFQRRTDGNKRVLILGDSSSDLAKREYAHYGKVTTDFVAIRGSIPGPVKRFVTLRKIVSTKGVKQPTILKL